ncbi:rhomboid family intramembrane serine protease [Bacillus inaquosorum]|uniref:rhomboid family intramembrane serine protease n=1 Tax=Bacillus inaquosorum TaxID=483913 RepID=UPI00227F3CF1|nr:rhomboid family intramembrane serine protease [Bacillus inaquosorum]MCY7903807.1 rhomboid family intramembrane serine protease [Bacillus inaquosorum]MCY7929772.1 rhomboid family intramembrane serine protease [Bacillus inaquosorum]MCY8237168.1 rhomboid family intramembrane serine protease [Bacillus inaquosorum]MCY8768969.1 rhomboid family intramembrane serine protease [Bacillus inaquosorum]MCY9012051.1 rhomboid family intramembrane serine protease [Bacillus inaquosorum]
MFIRTENFQTFIRLYPVVTFILALQAVLWLFFSLPVHSVVLWRDAVTGYNLGVANGEWWRLITPVLLHAGFTHLLFNSMSIFLFAPALERMLGKVRFLLVYAGSGIIGNIGTYVTEPLDYVHVGASGAIFGLFGVYLFMVLFRKELIGQEHSKMILTLLAFAVLMSFINSNINMMAHLFGLCGGFLLSFLCVQKKERRY